MTKFEQHISDIGYERYRYIDGKIEKTDRYLLSSMGDIGYIYIKEDHEISFGMSEKGLPPTLIYPRPSIKIHRNGLIERENLDSSMNILLQKESMEDIFKAIFDKNIVFEYHF